MSKEAIYNTRYGTIGMTSSPSMESSIKLAKSTGNLLSLGINTSKMNLTTAAKFTLKDSLVAADTPDDCIRNIPVEVNPNNTYGIPVNEDGSLNLSAVSSLLDSVNVTDNPSNTYGLATKYYAMLLTKMHNDDGNAHKELFDKFLTELTDMAGEDGKIHARQIGDEYGNTIYSNGKMVKKNDVDHPLFLVTSSVRNNNYDALTEHVDNITDVANNSIKKTVYQPSNRKVCIDTAVTPEWLQIKDEKGNNYYEFDKSGMVFLSISSIHIHNQIYIMINSDNTDDWIYNFELDSDTQSISFYVNAGDIIYINASETIRSLHIIEQTD